MFICWPVNETPLLKRTSVRHCEIKQTKQTAGYQSLLRFQFNKSNYAYFVSACVIMAPSSIFLVANFYEKPKLQGDPTITFCHIHQSTELGKNMEQMELEPVTRP